jgi:hypothetical protein
MICTEEIKYCAGDTVCNGFLAYYNRNIEGCKLEPVAWSGPPHEI